ncbi:MAG: alginate export family protein [Candidatus Ratteibacteria bacterium]
MKKFLFLFVFLSFFIFCDVKFDHGVDLRLREEYLGSIFAPVGKDDDNFFRVKLSLWGKWNFEKNNTIFIKFSGEPRFYVEKGGFLSRGRSRSDDEFIFENLYFEFKKLFGSNWDLKIGRQDFIMQYGEGFVIMEGTPGDGSRTFYFDALKATYHFNEKNLIDFVFFSNPREDYMPIINNQHKILRNSDEIGGFIYGKLNPFENIKLTLEPYYIYKHQEGYGSNSALGFNTIGTRSVYNFDPWRLRGEIAYQWGEYKDGRDKQGVGGYLFLTRNFKEVKFMPSIDIGYAYLSGDNPDTTDKDEGWDPVFGRWPWISELLLYYYFYDGEIAKFTNYNLWRASLNLLLSKNTTLSLSYNYFRANQRPVGPLLGTGKERGHLPTMILRHKFTPNISSHLWVEYFIPGNYYPDTHKNSIFFRWEVAFKF